MSHEALRQAAALIHEAHFITVLTGAGASQESGVPTFRDALTGLWEKYDPQDLATPEAFRRNPQLVWDWYAYRRELIQQAQPNPGHYALAQLKQHNSNLHIITQNVDDLHERAGSTHVIHLHGKIADSRCERNCQGTPTMVTPEINDPQRPPHCPHCGSYLRPDVVWFGEMLPALALQDAHTAARLCDVMLVVGTSGLVTPAAGLPHLARQHGATVIEINLQPTPITSLAQLALSGPAGIILPQLVKAVIHDT